MYADQETDCRVYHVCTGDKQDSFFCGDGTVFNQKILVCDYPKDTDCRNSKSYYYANEELGKPGAEPSNQAPSKTRQSNNKPQQFQGGFQPSQLFPQQQQQQQQQPQNSYDANDENGFVNEPVKKIRPTYKVVQTQQQTSYPSNRHGTSPARVLVSPAKSKIVQKALPFDQVGPVNQLNENYEQNYEQSNSYFSQQQTSGSQSGPIKQQTTYSTNQQQHYSTNQQPQQKYYNQQSNAPNGWKPINKPRGYSYNEINEQKVDLNIPKTSFTCGSHLPYGKIKNFKNLTI